MISIPLSLGTNNHSFVFPYLNLINKFGSMLLSIICLSCSFMKFIFFCQLMDFLFSGDTYYHTCFNCNTKDLIRVLLKTINNVNEKLIFLINILTHYINKIN